MSLVSQLPSKRSLPNEIAGKKMSAMTTRSRIVRMTFPSYGWKV
jgi:hypothetical protein